MGKAEQTDGRRTDAFNFTVAGLQAEKTPELRRKLLYDSTVRGLGLKIEPTDRRTYFWFRRVGKEKKHCWKTLGEFGDLSVQAARDAATKLNEEMATWRANGFVEGKAPRLENRPELTLGEANEQYVEGHLATHSKNAGRRMAETRRLVEIHLGDWKNRKLSAMTRTDIRERYAKISKASPEPGTARKKGGASAARSVVLHLKALFNWCIDQEKYRGENPAIIGKLVKKDEPRTRFLHADEMERLYAALDADPNQDVRDFIELALYTGQRRGDLFAMSWAGPDSKDHKHRSKVSLKEKTWTIPNPKNKHVHTVALTPEALEILERRAKTTAGSPWVFPSDLSECGHATDYKVQWERIRERAKLDDFRFHDLRHTYASWMAARNASLLVIQKAIGHDSQASSARYSHVNLDPVRATVNAVTAAMAAARKS
ncbi:MAG: site-specific integrase, partial [Candidatus Acidiferrales bacterium]